MAEIMDGLRKVFGGANAPSLEQLAAERQDFLNDAADMGGQRVDGYKLFEEYFAGERGVPLLERARQYLQRSGLPYTENFCETIVLAHKARLRVQGFGVENNETAGQWLSRDFWGRGRMDGTQGIVHLNTLKLGDGFIIVEWDEQTGRPCARWNHPSRIKPVYEDGDLVYVVKVWTTSTVSPSNPQGRRIRRLNLYYPDRVEKWFATSTDAKALWAPYLDADDYLDPATDTEDGQDGELVARWPTPWTENGEPDGEPLGINVFHFREQAGGDDFGRSILRTVLPLADALDKQSADLFYVMDTQGWKQRWGTGIKEGESLAVAAGEWVKVTSTDAKLGEFNAEDPRPLQEVIEGTIRRIAVKSRTPLHDLLVKGEQPSGEARKMADAAMVAATEDRHIDYGSTWEDVARMGWKLASIFGDQAPGFDDTAEIDVDWRDAEIRNELDEANTLLVHQELGASRATTLRKAGYDPDEEQQLRASEEPDVPAPPPPDGSTPPDQQD